jgi:hypothetical protein
MKTLLTIFSSSLLATSLMASVVTFQVHMDVQEALENFDASTDDVVVRGSFNGWGGVDPTLTDAGDGLYTGTFDIDDSNVGLEMAYKHVIVTPEGDFWESVSDRLFILEADGMTLEPVYYNDIIEVPPVVNAEILFRVNMEVQIANGNFDPEADLVVVRGGHTNIGDWGGAVALDVEGGNPGHYRLTVQFDNLPTDANLEYKFVTLTDGNPDLAGWESIASNRTVMPSPEWPDSNENGYLEFVTDEVYFSNTSWDDILAQDVNVHFTVDAWKIQAWFVDNPGEENYGFTSFDEVEYIGVCGPWNNWPWDLVPVEYQLAPSTGTFFEGTIVFGEFQASEIMYKYGANGSDNEAGFQADWVTTLDDSSPDFDINNTFGALGDWWEVVSVDQPVVASEFELNGNYPNPFNPVTRIDFTLRNAAEVSLHIFNILGQEVSFSSDFYASGSNSFSFDASMLSSGLYLYSVEANGQVETSKMLLVK